LKAPKTTKENDWKYKVNVDKTNFQFDIERKSQFFD
jgi:hypothetical protein